VKTFDNITTRKKKKYKCYFTNTIYLLFDTFYFQTFDFNLKMIVMMQKRLNDGLKQPIRKIKELSEKLFTFDFRKIIFKFLVLKHIEGFS